MKVVDESGVNGSKLGLDLTFFKQLMYTKSSSSMGNMHYDFFKRINKLNYFLRYI